MNFKFYFIIANCVSSAFALGFKHEVIVVYGKYYFLSLGREDLGFSIYFYQGLEWKIDNEIGGSSQYDPI